MPNTRHRLVLSTPLLSTALVVGLFALAVGARPASAATLTVCASGCDFTTIQDAVDAAAPGDTVQILAGRYVETVTVTKNLTLQGQGPVASIVDARQAGTVFSIDAADVRIVGLTITGGVAPASFAFGGGIRQASGVLRVSDSLIVGNRAGIGGGISSSGSGTLILNDTTIARNVGGGIHCGLRTVLSNSTVAENRRGSGIDCSAGPLILTNSTVAQNTAPGRGGGIRLGQAMARLTDSAVVNNVSGSSGGGVDNIVGSLDVIDSVIANNVAVSGGGVSVDAGTLSVSGTSAILNNQPDDCSAPPGVCP